MSDLFPIVEDYLEAVNKAKTSKTGETRMKWGRRAEAIADSMNAKAYRQLVNYCETNND